METIEYSPLALKDMQHIKDYVSTNFGEDLATTTLIKITSDIRKLEQYPMLGADLGEIVDVPTEYRYIFSGRNYVFYRIEYDKIRVVRVLNENQNFMATLFGISTELD